MNGLERSLAHDRHLTKKQMRLAGFGVHGSSVADQKRGRHHSQEDLFVVFNPSGRIGHLLKAKH